MSATAVSAAVEQALAPGRFFVAPPGVFGVRHVPREDVAWEVFRGHLLATTRERAFFECWHVTFDPRGAQPLISIRWQAERRQLHVTRQILTHGFAAYEESPGVILSRPTEKWVEELVGTLDVEQLETDELPAELATLVYLAVVGISRLPITSLESPLPSFSLGQLAYLPDLPATGPAHRDTGEFLHAALRTSQPIPFQARALETALRASDATSWPRIVQIVRDDFQATPGGPPNGWPAIFRTLFGGVALAPYTPLTARLVGLIESLSDQNALGPAGALDVLSYMLRYLGRHLTAFDLTLFHNFGANYPDALFLDELLRAFLKIARSNSRLLLPSDQSRTDQAARLRRRALRQACLLRAHYEGHRVPDAPTSMGENTRVLPAPFKRVPEEQIMQPAKRTRRLYEGEPLDGLLGESGRALLDASLADLDQASELAELGTAQYLDRPLGALKSHGEVDRTPLVSCVAFSRAIAKRRLAPLKALRWIDEARRTHLKS